MASAADKFNTATSAWREWQGAPWGRLRYSVAEANLLRHLDDVGRAPLRVLDLAGGDGGDAIRLAARGHQVTVADYSPTMLAAALDRASEAGLSQRIACVEADVTDLPIGLASGTFDVVLCHNVLPYVDDARVVLAAAVASARPGGLISVMTINRYSEPLRLAVRQADPTAAFAALDTDQGRTATFDSALTLHVAEDIIDHLRDLGCRDICHYGIRAFCDLITDDARKYDPAFFAELERLELATTARAPFKHTARLFQLTARTKLD